MGIRNCEWLGVLLRKQFNCLKFLNIMYSRNNTIIMSGIVCILVFLVVPRFTEGNDSLFRHPQGYTNPIPAYPQPVAPHYNGGLHYGDLGCCRSSFPDEYGSCRKRSDCTSRTQPYCSGYGYCTQSQDYGIEGCQDNCPKPNFARY